MSKQALERKLAAIEALRSAPDPCPELKKALADRNNFAVSKAAALVCDLRLADLIPNLVAAFHRFLENAEKTDPQCWAKNAIVRTLRDLDYDDADVFLRGSRHFQFEASWGGRVDSAAQLRAACALALANTTLADFDILLRLTDLLADPEKLVRADAARGMAQLPRTESILVLRLKARAGDPEPEVIGHCFASLMTIDSDRSSSFIAEFLSAEVEVRLEAAATLAASREPSAFESVRRHWEHEMDSDVRRAIIAGLGASPLNEAAEFVLSLIAESRRETAIQAIEALGASRFHDQMSAKVKEAVSDRGESAVLDAYRRAFD